MAHESIEEIFRGLKFPGFRLIIQPRLAEMDYEAALIHEKSGAVVTYRFDDIDIVTSSKKRILLVKHVVDTLFETYREKFLSQNMSELSQEFAVFYTKQDEEVEPPFHDEGEMWFR